MQKFNPEKELNKIQNGHNYRTSTIKGLFIPVLVLVCSLMAIAGTSFSANMIGTAPIHTVNIEMINGPVDSYIRQVGNGPFKDTINTDATFGSIKCLEGNINYDTATNTIYSDDIRENVKCVISYLNDGTKNIDLSSLNSINDNQGTSYYYKGDSTNNYLLLNDTMFRIIRLNGDGTFRLILDNTLNTSSLNDELYTNISNWALQFNNTNIEVVQEDFDVSNYTSDDINLHNLITTMGEYYDYGGLLSVKEAMIINENVSNSYLNNMLLSNFSDLNNVWVINESGINAVDKMTITNIKPVINVKINNLKGQGTEQMPYYVE